MFLPIYVDDIIVTSFFRCCNYSSSSQPEFRFCSQGSWRSLHYFLGIEVHKLPNGLLLNQDKYVTDLLARVGMHDCTSCPTPLSLNDNLSLTDGTPLGSEDSTCYRSIVGALQYLTLTRSDLAFSVNKVCQFIHAPTTTYWTAVKRMLRYIQGTHNIGITFQKSSSTLLSAYSDADWVGDLDDRRSTGGLLYFLVLIWLIGVLGKNPLSLVLVLRPNTKLLQMPLLNSFGLKLLCEKLVSL
jgi:histone deacetylase 1/2